MKAQVYIKGLDALEKETNKIIKEVTKGQTKLLLEQAQLVRDRIKEKAPLGPTGNLKKAAYAAVLPETSIKMPLAFAGIRPRKAPHAHLVEFGHGGPRPAPPHPFIRPAWDEVQETVRENIKTGIKKIVEGK